MKERIMEFLRKENKSAAQFAEEIDVQPSGISHILSGRNNPSLDFVIKMLEKYPFISTEWLLFGKGTMHKEPTLATLFDENQDIIKDSKEKASAIPDGNMNYPEKQITEKENRGFDSQKTRTSKIARIVWFYENNSFEEYFPVRD